MAQRQCKLRILAPEIYGGPPQFWRNVWYRPANGKNPSGGERVEEYGL